RPGRVGGAAALALLAAMLLAIAAPSFSANAKRGDDPRPARGDDSALAAKDAGAKDPAAKPASARKAGAKTQDGEGTPNTRSLQFVESADEVPDPYREAVQASASRRKPLKMWIDDLIGLGSQNVPPEAITEMRAMFPDIEPRDMAAMAAVGVTPEFVSQMRSAGIDVRSASDAQSLAAMGVTPAF